MSSPSPLVDQPNNPSTVPDGIYADWFGLRMPSVRGRTACNGCRSRKQKCDEKKPTCSRCQDLKRSCTWPKVQKRGPVKGYVEALEHRLDETETALLQLLSVVDSKTFDLAFRNDTLETIERLRLGGGNVTTVAGSEGRKADLVADWERLPLRSAREVRSWVEEMLKSSTANGGSRVAQRNVEDGGG